jgi:hypothetical protein
MIALFRHCSDHVISHNDMASEALCTATWSRFVPYSSTVWEKDEENSVEGPSLFNLCFRDHYLPRPSRCFLVESQRKRFEEKNRNVSCRKQPEDLPGRRVQPLFVQETAPNDQKHAVKIIA